jgi:ATP-dependent 26S proteasome regulatory subunit
MFGKRIPPEEFITARAESPIRPPSDDLKPLVRDFEWRLPRYTSADLILPAVTRAQYSVLLSRLHNHDLLYYEWGLAAVDPTGRSRAVNFYGPPGTGKTMCAEALAHDLGFAVLEVNYAEIESKYVGETPKRIEALFRAASQAAPTRVLLLFDEADAILGQRLTQVTQAADHSVNVSRAVMLKQLDAFAGVVAFATNLAENFDQAFVRRIIQHIPVLLPDIDNRRLLWQRLVPSPVPGRSMLDWDALAEASAELSGGDIRNAVVLGLAAAADRHGAERLVKTDDLVVAMSEVRRANREVGHRRSTSGTLTTSGESASSS